MSESERGKYFNPEKYRHVSIEKPPVSVGDRSVDPRTKTLEAPTPDKRTEDPVITEKNVEQERKNWRRLKLFSVGWISLILGGSGAGAYMYHTKQGPFAPDENVVETAPPITTEKEYPYEIPEQIKTNEDLRKALKKNKISANAEDFNFEGGTSGLHAKALRFVETPGNERLNIKDSYRWEPVIEKVTPQKKLALPKKSALLIAVQFINPYAQNNLDGVVNPGPSAHQYVARTSDEKDQNIIYFYFDKCINTKRQHALARVRIQHPANPEKNLWYRSFNLPECKTNANGVESDEPIQE